MNANEAREYTKECLTELQCEEEITVRDAIKKACEKGQYYIEVKHLYMLTEKNLENDGYLIDWKSSGHYRVSWELDEIEEDVI